MKCNHDDFDDIGKDNAGTAVYWCRNCGARKTWKEYAWTHPFRYLSEHPTFAAPPVAQAIIKDLTARIDSLRDEMLGEVQRIDRLAQASSERQEGGEQAVNERIDSVVFDWQKHVERLDLRNQISCQTIDHAWKRIDALSEAFEAQATALLDYQEFMSALEAISDKRRRRQSGPGDISDD